ncbi:hypothetical protein E0H73_10365 [Kribbella pittospori]|uniref:Uncharacterized protein n=1 Tax=Kribbella pittospori TaxID=722689 RepID=A0A4R0KUQ3_9ACTN|nr:hypothetical protein [Kribbella pittospori]TCC64753.1 hypothetical protein E0H73_10365 [Kribbella pittospori]
MEFLIGTIVSVVSAVIAWVTFAWQKRGGTFKRIHYSAVCEQFLMDFGDNAIQSLNSGPISVCLDPGGRKLIWPIAFKLKLANTGQAPILPGDFAGPLSIVIGDHCEFLGGVFSVNRGRADEFFGPGSAEVGDGRIKLSPFLFNPGDEITISGMLNGGLPDEGIVVSGRIAGVETLVRLDPRDRRGLTAQLRVTSMMYPSRHDWPTELGLDVKVLILPKFLPLDDFAPKSKLGSNISTMVNDVAVEKMHQVAIRIANCTDREVEIRESLGFSVETPSFLHLYEARLNDVEVNGRALRRILSWGPDEVDIRAGTLQPGEELFVSFVTEGDVADLRLAAHPSSVTDVQLARMTLPEKPLDSELFETAPRVLMMTPAIYRGFHAVRMRMRQRFLPKMRNVFRYLRSFPD